MKRVIISLAVMVSILSAVYSTVGQGARAEDEAAVRAIIMMLRDGWNAGDSKGFAAPFTEDADYVIVNGTRIKGRGVIDSGHRAIFDTIYKGSVLAATIQSVRFIRDDVAVAHVEWHLKYREGDTPREHKAMCSLVFSKQGREWTITAFHNTQIAAFPQR